MGWAIWLLVVGVLVAAAVWFGRRYAAARGARVVECPETKEPVAVSVSATQAALGGRFDLSECSRWPERQSCGRECLAQIERAPDGCLVRNIVADWYKGQDCAVCGKPLGEIDWLERKPGLLDATGVARPWPDVAPEDIPEALAHDRPICFDCYVSASFRQQHPELVIDNPWKQ